MNQSELIEKVAQATGLNQAAAGHAVKAVVNAVLDGDTSAGHIAAG
jgi:nucleoid DNA-binding protein